MNMKKSLAAASMMVLGLAACGKNSVADRIGDETNKKTTEIQMTGRWASPCDKKGLIGDLAGIKSSRVIFDFYANAGKTTQFFSDEGCTALVGQAAYTGTSVVGTPSAVDSANILDLNYQNVVVTISDQATADLLNSPLTPACGISDWKVNEARDVTAQAEALNCPIPKAAQVFDIVKTDGTSLHFGLADAGHNKATQEARPVELDNGYTFTKQ